jgi:GT2 family glycosyltransferase
MTMPQVTAVTLNWNRADDTLACLASLSEQSYPNLHLLVVDNGSTDDSVARIRDAFPEWRCWLIPTTVALPGVIIWASPRHWNRTPTMFFASTTIPGWLLIPLTGW